MNTVEDKKRFALKLALEFLQVHCRSRFLMELQEYPQQWADFCITKNTIISALRDEAKKKPKKTKNKEKQDEKLQTPLP